MKFLIILCLAVAIQANGNCPYKCTFNQPHIKCDYQSEYGPCPSDLEILNITQYRATILPAHNTKRNLIAGGGLENYGYGKAARMATTRWSRELAELAELHIQTCDIGTHDCHDTENYPYSGQNLGWQTISSLDNSSRKQAIEEIIESWWSEHTGGFVINHFLAMALEQNSRVGCAAGTFTHREKGQILLLACNYARGLIRGKKSYTPGEPGSGCQTGTNRKFPNLCSPTEKYSHIPDW